MRRVLEYVSKHENTIGIFNSGIHISFGKKVLKACQILVVLLHIYSLYDLQKGSLKLKKLLLKLNPKPL